MSEPCYNLVYLELAACRLITLPADFARTVPNVRVLNLNYNFLEDPSPLEGLTRLRKLTIIGSRIKGAKQLVRVLRGMKDMEMIDFRQVFLALFASFAPYTSPIARVLTDACGARLWRGQETVESSQHHAREGVQEARPL